VMIFSSSFMEAILVKGAWPVHRRADVSRLVAPVFSIGGFLLACTL
jgi:hypothetical protein